MPTVRTSYAHPEDLVSTEWLAAHIDRFDVRVIDGSFTLPGVMPTAQEAYAKGGPRFYKSEDDALLRFVNGMLHSIASVPMEVVSIDRYHRGSTPAPAK